MHQFDTFELDELPDSNNGNAEFTADNQTGSYTIQENDTCGVSSTVAGDRLTWRADRWSSNSGTDPLPNEQAVRIIGGTVAAVDSGTQNLWYKFAYGEYTTTTVTSTPVYALDGSIDELATFTVALSADEIYNAYQRGAETFALVGTVAYDDADTIGEFTESGLDVNEAPVYQIGAENLMGETMSETILQAITAVPPDAPTSVTAVAVAGQINVSWQAPSFDGGSAIIDYVVYRTDNPTTIVHTTTSTSWSGDTSGADGVGYVYKVHARNVMGEGAAGTSNTEVFGNVPAQAALATVLALAGLGIRLDWNDPDDHGYTLTSYLLEYTDDGGTNWSTASSASWANTFTHTGLTEGDSYQYRLTATNALGSGPVSNITSPAVVAGDVPDAPGNMSATAVAGSQIDLAWDEPDDHEYTIDKYDLYRSTDGVTWGTAHAPNLTVRVYRIQA